MKTCSKCEVRKSGSEFYAHPYGADGLMSKCKECTKRDARENRKSKTEYYREYDRWRYQNHPQVRERHKRYSQTDRGKESHKRSHQRWKERNASKRAAHVLTGNAIRDGKLEREPCEVCGATKVHAHHDDYAKPLEVRWLCPKHHQEWHDRNGEGRNAE